ncbi:MAG: hypothetical protein EOO91_20345 [Pedobacter sp.]|nr:MAG: hypothetical protein EOO91_20345 [Pedobacter sp.]
MPLRIKDIEEMGVPISFLKVGEVSVRVGPCSGRIWSSAKIPLDGRHYRCSGKIILKNGLELRANFEISTHTFDFLERDSVRIYIENEDAWYAMSEDELYEILGVSKENALPYQWLPDRELEYSKKGPYPMYYP